MPFLNSSAIARVEHDEKTGDLEIWFRDGRHTYVYPGVPRALYQGLLNASSAGRYFDAHIKDVYSARG